ncbi:flagellar hook-associated protein FlgK [Alloacidobacterium dinghuense]|uniref:Flagellar hook-associated protein 1 n=1 Tax=Alloacidobacterium dinghuense TaxID=2763107 RepID=A0A7G8BNM0_9BACT|nr:flagellar hook-associated protein FlgK [Alloacidobacterium dinghuense]QNI34140.1 flagellar hook-associated protein FlgK [Alloacidobacterium dinghuense]
MATLNTALSIATGALDADQAAINIIANNTSNANTPGYTNQVPEWQANDPVTIGGTSYGQGVTMTGPSSQRDLVLEQRIQQQMQLQQGSDARQTALEGIENIFSSATSASPSTSSLDIGTSISGFFSALSQLQSNPADTSLRQSVLNAATTLANSFQSASSQLTAEQGSLDQQGATIVIQVNSLTQAIAQLNSQISQTSGTSDAGQLEDHRQYDIEQLSQLVGIHEVTTEDNSLTITTSSGAPLVSKGQAFSLNTSVSGGVTHISDYQGNDISTALASGGGQLGGILTVRDQDIPQMQSTLDTLAFDLGTAVNNQNALGSDANGNPGGPIFNLPGTAAGAASSISVAITDPAKIAAAAAGNGSSDDTNLEGMLQLQNQTIIGGATPSGYYSSFVSALGSLVSEVSTENTAQQASLTQLQTQRDSLSAVNLNDQAAALENLQQAYQAASKVFTILDTVMASAINLGVETTVA